MTDVVTTGRRAQPAQARSVITVERILDAAHQVLAEQGVPGFNTNAVAKAAGVNVGTLYHYFADKHAILLELVDRSTVERAEAVGDLAGRLDAGTDLDTWLDQVLAAVSEGEDHTSSAAVLRRACRAVPALADAERAAHSALADQLSVALRRRSPQLSVARATVAARMIVEVATHGLDLTAEPTTLASAVRGELVVALRAYLRELDAEG